MSSQSADISDEDARVPPFESITLSDKGRRSRSTRACDHCRRTKSKCERLRNVSGQAGCRGCAALGLSCTFTDPSHKRGPPKGYILALERRLHQVEALLGTIIGADDPRARDLVQDLSKDKLASHIIQKVNVGPFGIRGKTDHPFSTTKEDFLASISGDINDDALDQSGSGQDDLAFCSPGSDWQEKLKELLRSSSQSSRFDVSTASIATSTITHTPHPERTRRATFPSADVTSSFMYPSAGLSSCPSNPTLLGLNSWCPESLLRTSIDPPSQQVAHSASAASSGLLHVMDNIYVDSDGRFRTASGGPITRAIDCPTSPSMLPPSSFPHHTYGVHR